MLEYSNEFFQSALSVSSLVFGGARFLRPAGGTSAHRFYEIEQAIAQIDEFAELEDGWAGPGSLAPSRLIREIARAAIRTPGFISQVPDISPMPNGTIAFDWESESGSANLEIGEDDFSFYLDLDGTFFPLFGASRMLPVIEMSEIISNCFSPAPPVQRTQPTSYQIATVSVVPSYA